MILLFFVVLLLFAFFLQLVGDRDQGKGWLCGGDGEKKIC